MVRCGRCDKLLEVQLQQAATAPAPGDTTAAASVSRTTELGGGDDAAAVSVGMGHANDASLLTALLLNAPITQHHAGAPARGATDPRPAEAARAAVAIKAEGKTVGAWSLPAAGTAGIIPPAARTCRWGSNSSRRSRWVWRLGSVLRGHVARRPPRSRSCGRRRCPDERVVVRRRRAHGGAAGDRRRRYGRQQLEALDGQRILAERRVPGGGQSVGQWSPSRSIHQIEQLS